MLETEVDCPAKPASGKRRAERSSVLRVGSRGNWTGVGQSAGEGEGAATWRATHEQRKHEVGSLKCCSQSWATRPDETCRPRSKASIGFFDTTRARAHTRSGTSSILINTIVDPA